MSRQSGVAPSIRSRHRVDKIMSPASEGAGRARDVGKAAGGSTRSGLDLLVGGPRLCDDYLCRDLGAIRSFSST